MKYFTEEEKSICRETGKTLNHFGKKKGNLIPILQKVQDRLGYLPKTAIIEIASYINVPVADVYSVATFYSQFRLVPTGQKLIRVCCGTACHFRGGAAILHDIEKKLSIKPGETTEDRKYTLETVACIGACALAPVITINKKTYGQMSPEKIAEVFDG